jgi:Ricin-type beta-trefoil lectin domain
MKRAFVLLFWTLLLGPLHVPGSHAFGPLPSSPFPTQIVSTKGDALGGGCIDAPLPQPPNAEGGGVWFIQQFPCNGGANQHWSFESQPAGTFLIHSTFNPRFCLDLFRGAMTAGTRIQLFPCHGGSNQQWIVKQADGNTSEISPQTAPDMVLDVANGVARRRAVIQIFPRQGSANQRWRFPVDGLPQGLTGGIAYVNHDCQANIGAYIAAGIAAIGLIACGIAQSETGAWASSCLQVIQGTSGTVGTIAAGTGGFTSCGDPKVFRGGAVLAIGESNPVATLLLDGSGSSFSVHAAPGWLTMSDGDKGSDRDFGFYHQELSAPSMSVSDTSVSDRFVLPRGTACGFHHTRNTPFSVMQRFALGNASTCMGHDPGQGDCPGGWQAKNHFDGSSGDGSETCVNLAGAAGHHCDYFAWCEYQDPNGLCDADPNCFPNAQRRGFGFSVASDTDAAGAVTLIRDPPVNDAPCPVGWIRTNAHDDGRDRGQGLSWCHPLPQDLPHGLTAGLAYAPDVDIFFGSAALGNKTPLVGDGFILYNDGDIGGPTGTGFYHQHLDGGGVNNPELSQNLKLLKGAACGFHHTKNTPGIKCMGHDPAQRDCPIGWQPRNHFDMSSGSDGNCRDLNDQAHCAYFVWCEYQDPNRLCAPGTDAFSECGYWAKFIGYTVGIASNTDPSGTSLAWGLACPDGWSPRTPFFDAGRPSRQGISWCMP